MCSTIDCIPFADRVCKWNDGLSGVRLGGLSLFRRLISSSIVFGRQERVEFLSTWKTKNLITHSSHQEASSTILTQKIHCWILDIILCYWHWFQGKRQTLKNLPFLPLVGSLKWSFLMILNASISWRWK